MREINCMDCIVGNFKDSLCEKEFCEKFKCAGDGKDFIEYILEVQRPHGEWIEHRTQDIFGYFHSEYECSNCHDDVFQKTEWQFCPNCGSDNRKKEGERE